MNCGDAGPTAASFHNTFKEHRASPFLPSGLRGPSRAFSLQGVPQMTQVIDAPVTDKPPVQDPKFGDFLKSIQKPIEEDKTPPMYAIVLHNDGSTFPDFVVTVLREAFGIPHQQAYNIMMTVHRGDRGVVHIVSKEEADKEMATAALLISKAVAGEDFADFVTPTCELRFTSEPETKGEGK